MRYNDLIEAEMDIGFVEFELHEVRKELKKVSKTLNTWEALSVEDMIYTANCIKAAGVKNFREFRKWEKENPNCGFVRIGNEVRKIKKE